MMALMTQLAEAAVPLLPGMVQRLRALPGLADLKLDVADAEVAVLLQELAQLGGLTQLRELTVEGLHSSSREVV